ncbi:MAG: carboxy terminal-processing peptidase [Bacteroidetes bacterium]|nr:carboxy terminal-processing peptidase [Bacteroidota bacterium]
MELMMSTLGASHYQPLSVDDSLSAKVFKMYLPKLDYSKKIFTQKDIKELREFEYRIDNDINDHTHNFYNKANALYVQRIKQCENFYKEILATPFTFDVEESVVLDPDKIDYPVDENQLKEEWRKSLKYQVLARITDMIDAQEKAKEKKDTTFKSKSFEEMEKDAREKVRKSNEEFFKRVNQLSSLDRYNNLLYTISSIYDPHTEFFAPKEKKNFDIGMTGQLEGIGAQLQEKDGYIKVSNVVPGSASWRQGSLKAGDLILKVAQGANEPVDVVGMRLDDAVELIRGKKGTEVRLTVKKADESITTIPIVRDIVVLEETYAHSLILNNNKSKIGYIKLPGFYSDFDGKGGRRCAVDVRTELNKLKKENVQGVILDLRDNGGGSLQDAVEMAGLFIASGPIVQVKSRLYPAQVLKDNDSQVVYDGPLVVMVNQNSASASEILAAAIQDYKRGIVVGTNSTFGKGTVQRFINLDDYLLPAFDSLKPLGSLKVTFQKFYRINGGATQLRGVVPDVILPDPYTYIETGEKDLDYPMPWDEIKPAEYELWNKKIEYEKIKKASSLRVASNSSFTAVTKRALELKEVKEDLSLPLTLSKAIAEKKESKEKSKKFEDATSKEISGFEIVALQVEDALLKSDTLKGAKHKDLVKNLRKDFYLHETTNIINDLK